MTKRLRAKEDNGHIHGLARERSTTPPSSLATPISPPRSRQSRTMRQEKASLNSHEGSKGSFNLEESSLAAIEAGQAEVPDDHLHHFSSHLQNFIRDPAGSNPLLSIPQFVHLYRRNEHVNGHHFVIHQHDHPIAGVHYDLRLQFSQSSSISFAIIYGLPGNPNSQRPNRNAMETRVHNVWNHLVETASCQTGSLLIWDTGEYEVLPFHNKQAETDVEESSDSANETNEKDTPSPDTLSENEKLIAAFQKHRIRLRLHGTRLRSYVLSLRLHSPSSHPPQPSRPTRKRRRKAPSAPKSPSETPSPPPSSPIYSSPTSHTKSNLSSSRTQTSVLQGVNSMATEIAEKEVSEIRRQNAYPGAANTIGSIHQRRWFLSLDRVRSGFTKSRDEQGAVRWTRKRVGDGEDGGFEPFVVRGRDVERSIISGRRADEVMRDEGVVGFVGRKGWRAVVE